MGEASRKTAAAEVSAPPPTVRETLMLVQIKAGEWELHKLTIVGNLVTAEKRVGHAYYRDLIEQQAAKVLRTMGRK
jgi:hypothetical protein